jgi:hypothetical protein
MTKIKGGYLERPVFLFDPKITEETDKVCNKLNFVNESIFEEFKKNTDETKNYTQIAPLFRFLINIKKECLKENDIIILRDIDKNHIFISENLTDKDDEKDVHIFQLTKQYKILYTGTQQYKDIKGTIYTFDDFVNDNQKKINDKYSLFDMKIAYDKKKILKIFQRYEFIQKPEFQEENNIKIVPMKGFKKFMEKYCSPQKDARGNITNIIYHENYNIINFMAFVNMMPELFNLIELDYKHYNDFDDVSKICPEFYLRRTEFEKEKKVFFKGMTHKLNINLYDDIYYDLHLLSNLNNEKIKMLKKRTKYTEDNEDEEKYIKETENKKENIKKNIKKPSGTKIEQQIQKEEDIKIKEDKISKLEKDFNNKKIAEINKQKNFLKNLIYDKKNNEEQNDMFKDPIYICYLYDTVIKNNIDDKKLYDEKLYDEIVKLYDEYGYNYIKKFRYAICLLSKIHNMNKDKIFDKITYAYNYKEIGEQILSIDKLKQNNMPIKTQIGQINKLIDETYYKKRHHYFDFIVEIIEFLDDLHNIRKEFVSNNICFYNEFVKLFVGQCYFNYLQEKKFSYLPFSIKSHSKRYVEISEEDDNDIPYYFITKEGAYNMPLIAQKLVQVGDKKFASCGETNLLNFIKYILTDTTLESKKITQEKIDLLKKLYPENKLKEIFDTKIVEQQTDIIQTELLENKLNDFAVLMSYYTTKIGLYNRETCELNPTLDNSMHILQNILGIKKEDIKEEGKIFIKEISEKFGKKCEITLNGDTVVYDDKVRFLFNNSHAETQVVGNLKLPVFFIEKYSNNMLLKIEESPFLTHINNIFIYNNQYVDDANKYIVNVQYDVNYYLEYNDCFKIDFKLPFHEKIPEKAFRNVKIINFGNHYKSEIGENLFPSCEKVVFGDYFNNDIHVSSFKNVKKIIFGKKYNKPINDNAFPKCEKVIFGYDFNERIPASSFINVKEIEFGFSYNQPIEATAFSSCQKVVFGESFNQIIPATSFINVKEIEFGFSYNQPIEDTAFSNCKKVVFGKSFNQIIPASSFTNVEEIIFGYLFNQEISKGAFSLCKKVEFGWSFNQIIPASSFTNVEEIIFGYNYNQPISLGVISLCKKVKFGESFNQKILINTLTNVEEIIFGYYYNQPFCEDAFPLCKKVEFGLEFNANIPANSFKTVKNIIFGYSYNQPINDNSFPDCEEVIFGDEFNQNIPASLSKNVKQIKFGYSYDIPINNDAFPSCKKVEFGTEFNQNIPESSFKDVRQIIFGYSYNQPINNECFPKCEKVTFGKMFNENIPATAFKSIQNINYNNYSKIINLYDGKIIPIDKFVLSDNPNIQKILDSELMKRLKKENEIKTGGSNNYKQKYLKYKQKYLNLKNKISMI